jgi:protein-S-isoprenylcysteine O-methyltransferase Ste14
MSESDADGRTMNAPTDNPGVIARPPLLYAGVLIVALLVNLIWPLPIFADKLGRWCGLLLVVLGAGIVVWGRNSLVSSGTSVDPGLPTTAIVTSGPYRFSRNPLYVGLTALFLGLTMTMNTWWGILALIPLLTVMHNSVILREERYLEAKFGETYRRYRAAVRRYL